MRPLPLTQVTAFLESRQGLLDGVVLSGGECTLSPDLPQMAALIKSMGYMLKIDTNGTRPDMLETLIKEDLVDFVALDLKAPPAKYHAITGLTDDAPVWRSLALLCASDIPLEVRTTVHTDLLDEEDINALTAILDQYGFQGYYAVQSFRHGITLGNLPRPTRSLETRKLKPTHFKTILRNVIEKST